MKKKGYKKRLPNNEEINQSKGVAGPNDGKVNQLKANMDQSPKVQHLAQLQKDADAFTSQQPTAQLKEETSAPKTNMPKKLAQGVESQTGVSMDGVKVHYNSDKPAQLQAKAFAQGKDIHLGKGESKHLPHEAVHVAQQMKGDVKPTGSVNGTAINDSPKLEREADVLGAKAKSGPKGGETSQLMKANGPQEGLIQGKLNADAPVQRKVANPGEYMGYTTGKAVPTLYFSNGHLTVNHEIEANIGWHSNPSKERGKVGSQYGVNLNEEGLKMAKEATTLFQKNKKRELAKVLKPLLEGMVSGQLVADEETLDQSKYYEIFYDKEDESSIDEVQVGVMLTNLTAMHTSRGRLVEGYMKGFEEGVVEEYLKVGTKSLLAKYPRISPKDFTMSVEELNEKYDMSERDVKAHQKMLKVFRGER